MLKLCLTLLVATHAAVVLAQPGGGGGTPGGQPTEPIYDPFADTRFYCGYAAVEHVSFEAFGWYDEAFSTNLRLTQPILEGDRFLHGVNSAGQVFSVQCTSLIEFDLDGEPGGNRGWMWSGLFGGPAGEYPCHGFVVEEASVAWCVPNVALRNAATAFEQFEFLSDMSMRAICSLDEIAQFTRDQNEIDYRACFDQGEAQYHGLVVGFGVVGLASCATGVVPVCIGSGVALIGIGISHSLWEHDMKSEWGRANMQLCLDSQWRRDHPNGPPPPAPSRGEFSCPDPVMIPLRW